MYSSDDPRADTWANYIQAIPGPLATGYPLEIYATHPKTIEAIKKAKQVVLQPHEKPSSK
jgi:hypothetical protein